MKVYYQATDGSLCELTRTNGEWSAAATVPGTNAYGGTAIAAVGWDATIVRVYFQVPNNGIWEAAAQNGTWNVRPMLTTGGDQISAQLGSPIAAIRLLDSAGVSR